MSDDQPVAADDDHAVGAELIDLNATSERDRAFDELYRREHLAMLRLGFLLTSDRDAAAEVAHDSFVKTYQQWDRLDTPGAYLRRSVVNGCNDHHRRRIRRATRSVAEVAELADRADPRTEAEADEQLADAIARLPPKRRAAIVLRYYMDLPQREIAETLGIRQGTVKSLLHRGLEDLRIALGEPPADTATSRADTPLDIPLDPPHPRPNTGEAPR